MSLGVAQVRYGSVRSAVCEAAKDRQGEDHCQGKFSLTFFLETANAFLDPQSNVAEVLEVESRGLKQATGRGRVLQGVCIAHISAVALCDR